MRRFVKVFLPILLVLVILLVSYWFFFRYRSDMTADLFAKWGSSRLAADDAKGAVRLYEYAHKLSPDDAEISVKLAEAYRGIGNYTKTEYMLVHAIYSDPENVDLYLALSSAYLDQDKLLDAQVMLDHINNETVRQKLDALRPAAPVITPEGGKYSDYISVAVEAPADATCYLTTDGEFPSLVQPPYSGPITLEAGETTVCAIAVGNNGLVSTAVYAGYTVAGIVEDVTFSDKVLEDYIKEQLNKQDVTLKTSDLWAVSELTVPEGVATLSDLKYFTGLESLTVHGYTGEDYSFLNDMPKLKMLDLSGCSIYSDGMTLLSSCMQLTDLNLSNCGLSNISGLSSLTNLKTLNLDDNSINDLTPLEKLSVLEELRLCRNAVTSLTSLSNLSALRILDVSLNSVDTVSPLSACTALSELYVSDNMLTDLTVVSSLAGLTVIDASKNQIEDVSGIENCTMLERFILSDNKLVDISGLANIATLTEVNIDYNDVLEVPDFVDGCTLVTFSAAHNFLENVNGLDGLPNLNYVNMDYNNIRDISCLLNCPNLVQVNVFGTYIDDAQTFRDHGIIVNYDPT